MDTKTLFAMLTFFGIFAFLSKKEDDEITEKTEKNNFFDKNTFLSKKLDEKKQEPTPTPKHFIDKMKEYKIKKKAINNNDTAKQFN